MIRWLIGAVLGIIANAIGLFVASLILDGFSIDFTSFIISVIIFSVASGILGPFISKVAFTKASFLMSGIGLVNTLVALIITSLVSQGISIDGIETWLLATVIVWFFSMIGNVLLPLIIFKLILDKRKAKKSTSPASPIAQS